MTSCTTQTCDAPATASTTRPKRTPRSTARATEDGLEIRFDVPGATRETIELTVEDGELHLAATTRLTDPEGPFRSSHLEFRATDFDGRWALPEDVTAEGATTALEHGILTLTLPRRAKTRHEIEIG